MTKLTIFMTLRDLLISFKTPRPLRLLKLSKQLGGPQRLSKQLFRLFRSESAVFRPPTKYAILRTPKN